MLIILGINFCYRGEGSEYNFFLRKQNFLLYFLNMELEGKCLKLT